MNQEQALADDLKTIAVQEDVLQFDHFNAETAWDLGIKLKTMCEADGVSVTIEIRFAKETVFFFAMGGTSPNNADWARRKRNTTELMHQSSYGVRLSLSQKSESLATLAGLPLRDYATHGGSFPIKVKGTGCVGAVTVSGLPDREDHNVVVRAIAALIHYSASDIYLAKR